MAFIPLTGKALENYKKYLCRKSRGFSPKRLWKFDDGMESGSDFWQSPTEIKESGTSYV